MATNSITFLLFVVIVTNYGLRRHIINHSILSAESKVRVTLQNSIKHSGSERVKESFFPHPRLTLSLIPMHSYLTIDFFSFQEILGPNINNVLTWMTCPKKVALVWTEPLRLINWALIPTVEEVWRHVTMVAKFLDLNNLSWQRRPFVLSNDGKKSWAIVLFLSAIKYRKVIHVNFFAFSAILMVRWDPENFFLPWQRDDRV